MGIDHNGYPAGGYDLRADSPTDGDEAVTVPAHEWLIINEAESVEPVPAYAHEHAGLDTSIPYERITDIAVGAVDIIRHDTSLSYTIDDLVASLISEDNYPYVHDAAHPRLYTVPGRPDILLRCNDIENLSLPDEPTAAIERILHYEHLLGKLEGAGMPILRRSVFVVEQDPYTGEPTVYTVTERTTGDALNPHNPQYTEISTQLCSILVDHLTGPLQYTLNDLSYPAQYSKKGQLLDYDPHLSNTVSKQLKDLHGLEIWVKELADTPNKYEMLKKIHAARAYCRH